MICPGFGLVICEKTCPGVHPYQKNTCSHPPPPPPPTHTHTPRSLLRESYNGVLELPDWLITSRTILTAKNTDTHLEKNYRQIACLNTTYKLYTSILNDILNDNCITNNVITVEQAGGKKGSWGCPDQLLINKMGFDEVRQYNRNIFTMWFDYQKAFDSIPHQWLFQALKLAKVPVKLTSTIERLAYGWATNVSIQTNESFSVTDIIKYLTGILQGDCLSLILFVLCVNPLSHLLNKLCDGYRIGTPGNRTTKINHLLFIDDLKTYAPNIAIAKEQLKLISQFTNDIGMRFGVDKCAYMYIEHGKRKSTGTELEMDGLKISELQDTDSYKYLGGDEDVAYWEL